MKKILLFFNLFLTIFFVIGCSKVDKLDLFSENLSEVRENFYYEIKNDYVLTFSSGIREKDYKLDGKCDSNKAEFGLIVLYSMSNKNLDENKFQFDIKINDKHIINKFEKNPYDGSLVFDIGEKIDKDYIDINLIFGESSDQFKLKNISKLWKVNCYDALEIASAYNIKEIENLFKRNKINCEVYIKIGYDFSINEDFFWYIKFLKQDFNDISIIIDPITGNVVNFNKNIV